MMKKAAMAGILLLVVLAVASCSDDDSTGSKDSTAPAVSIVAPKNAVTREGIVDVSISANDNAGISKVEFYADGQLVGTDTTTPYEVEWDLSGYDDDTQHTFYAKAYDTGGNVKVTETRTLTKGPSAVPVATLTSPVDGWTVMQGYLTELTGSATDLEDGVLSDANIVWSSDLQGVLKSGTDVDYRGFIIGTHEITMTATDEDGNVDTKTVTITVTENDQDYAYVQEGTYTIGAPLFEPTTVTFTRPFIVSKTELSLRDFLENMDTSKLTSALDFTRRGSKLAEKVDSLDDLPLYNRDIVEDVDTYGDYPATFFTYLEYAMYCESINDRDGFNPSYAYYGESNVLKDRIGDALKLVLWTHEDPNYDMNGWRMPTEAEWMVAAGGGLEGHSYPWGDSPAYGKANTLADPNPPSMALVGEGRGTVPVDSYAEYPSPYGVLNMAGNVAEVCSDIYQPDLPSGVDYVGYSISTTFEYLVKGGAWYSTGPQSQIAVRDLWIPYARSSTSSIYAYNAGFGTRVVRSLNVGEAPW